MTDSSEINFRGGDGGTVVKPWQVSPNATLAEMAGDFAFAAGLARGTMPLDASLPGAALLRIHERTKLIELCGRIAAHGERLGVDASGLLRLRARLAIAADGAESKVDTELWEEANILVNRIVERSAAKSEPATAPPSPDVLPKVGKQARALALLYEHPEWSDGDIAERVPCNRTSLYRMEKYQAARTLLKQGRMDRSHGSKSREGDIEAWDDD
jgi:hypothetical protein